MDRVTVSMEWGAYKAEVKAQKSSSTVLTAIHQFQSEGHSIIKTHNNFSFEDAAVVEGFDVVLTPAFE